MPKFTIIQTDADKETKETIGDLILSIVGDDDEATIKITKNAGLFGIERMERMLTVDPDKIKISDFLKTNPGKVLRSSVPSTIRRAPADPNAGLIQAEREKAELKAQVELTKFYAELDFKRDQLAQEYELKKAEIEARYGTRAIVTGPDTATAKFVDMLNSGKYSEGLKEAAEKAEAVKLAEAVRADVEAKRAKFDVRPTADQNAPTLANFVKTLSSEYGQFDIDEAETKIVEEYVKTHNTEPALFYEALSALREIVRGEVHTDPVRWEAIRYQLENYDLLAS